MLKLFIYCKVDMSICLKVTKTKTIMTVIFDTFHTAVSPLKLFAHVVKEQLCGELN